MVDYIKAHLLDARSKLLDNPILDFKGDYNRSTGEINETKLTAKHRNLIFLTNISGYTEMTGSLHQYMNDGKHNYNDFTFNNLQNVLFEISEKFDINLKNIVLQNIEFGMNISPKVSTTSITQSIVLRRNVFFKDVLISGKGSYKNAKYGQYCIKAYDKASQHNLEENIFRWELHYKKMEKLNKLGIKTLYDLTKTNWIDSIGELLVKTWDETLFIEEQNDENILDEPLRMKVLEWSNPMFWRNLSKQKRYDQKKKYMNYLKNNSYSKKADVKNLLEEKWRYLRLNLPIDYLSIISKSNQLEKPTLLLNIEKDLKEPIYKRLLSAFNNFIIGLYYRLFKFNNSI